MSFSLSSGGEASVVVGRSFLGSLPLAFFVICSSLQPLWSKKMPANRRPHKATVVYFQSYWNVFDGTAIIMSSAGTSVGCWDSWLGVAAPLLRHVSMLDSRHWLAAGLTHDQIPRVA
jgi:hypothetical protein